MFARARITLRHRESALLVPEDSVQWEGCCNIVFVRNSDTEFEPRKVHLGVATGNVYEVLSGVKEGEDVVTQGSFLLKTEILKGNIGAGCCEIDPGS
jgi:cobalt-zinc-cadmium efflux system membrane fusion protein